MYKTSLVITTINKPNQNMKMYARACKINKWNFIVVGDKKTPKNFKLIHSEFINYKKKIYDISFSKACPTNSYARKNIGYLYAIKNESQVIVETDDDNTPLKNFFLPFSLYSYSNFIYKKKDWINIYNYFVKKKYLNKIWPRGLPLNKITKDSKEKILKKKKQKSLIIQSLCNGNPDVDAIFRLMNSNAKNIEFKKNKKFFISKNCYVPFNSQSTTWYYDAFPLLYLPVTCTFRSTDIWRSLIAQIILNFDNELVLFQSPIVFQNRNKHDLMNDFKSEVPVYLESQNIINLLKNINLKKGPENYLHNLLTCYKILVKNNIFNPQEIIFLKLWINDFKRIKSNNFFKTTK
jgi:hypothetical protein